VFAKIPGFAYMEKAITALAPLRRGTVTERDGKQYVS
jgi:hypothetical protein